MEVSRLKQAGYVAPDPNKSSQVPSVFHLYLIPRYPVLAFFCWTVRKVIVSHVILPLDLDELQAFQNWSTRFSFLLIFSLHMGD